MELGHPRALEKLGFGASQFPLPNEVYSRSAMCFGVLSVQCSLNEDRSSKLQLDLAIDQRCLFEQVR